MITDYYLNSYVYKEFDVAYQHELKKNYAFALDTYRRLADIAEKYDDEGVLVRAQDGIARCELYINQQKEREC